MPRQTGFTLVELLIVLALAALLMSAVPALFSAALPGLELKAAARRTAATLRLAQEMAIRRGTVTEVLIDVESRQLTLAAARPVTLPASLTLQLEIAARDLQDDQRGIIRFFPDGTATGGRIMLTYNAHGYQVGVTWLTGRITIAPWTEP
ncbi:type II secretion system protein GspH [Chromatium okenii]|uniref:GspH/FimT family pseudopilin n=1 Tax=Chromatium okenii TaxID=61644 RepID=UPI001907C3EF|nr:GspH/FimT family pseudopilin [Chromatium okenii]MBK1641826.1 type II secretion system protein GspH [Chromatium okenii]